jgi:hypothetical protein
MANPELNPLELSDEDFIDVDPSTFDDDLEELDDDPTDGETDDSDSTDDTDDDDADANDSDDGTDGDDEPDDADEPDEGETDTDKTDSDPTDSADTTDNVDADKPDVKPTVGTMTDADYLAVGKQVMSEFKANGTKIKMKSADDIIQLMQMGANYHKKMSGLKPSLKTLKLLENNGLLEPDKLNFLIDLSQNKPEAITKLLKDSNLDPMEMDLDSETTYTPSKRTVSDIETVIDTVLDSIKDSEYYDRTLTVLGDDWDEASRVSISEQPELIRTVNAHMEAGIFDQVMDAVTYERRLGKLAGISDLEAYQRVGTYMHENKLFSVNGQAQSTDQQQGTQNSSNPNHNAQDDQQAQRQSRKKAASPSRQRKSSPTKSGDYNPLAMSDEEFAKVNNFSL